MAIFFLTAGAIWILLIVALFCWDSYCRTCDVFAARHAVCGGSLGEILTMYRHLFSWRGINNMNAISKTSKLVLTTMVIGACVVGCNRQTPDSNEVSSTRNSDTTTASGAQSGTSNTARDTSGTTSGSDTAGTSGSGTTGTSATGGTSTVGTVISDSVVTTKVKTALLADSDIKGLDINVTTNKGEVSLNGAVNNQSQIERAEKIARSIDGVKSVQNNVTIKKS
jgi:hyperosmotically inducible protein